MQQMPRQSSVLSHRLLFFHRQPSSQSNPCTSSTVYIATPISSTLCPSPSFGSSTTEQANQRPAPFSLSSSRHSSSLPWQAQRHSTHQPAPPPIGASMRQRSMRATTFIGQQRLGWSSVAESCNSSGPSSSTARRQLGSQRGSGGRQRARLRQPLQQPDARGSGSPATSPASLHAQDKVPAVPSAFPSLFPMRHHPSALRLPVRRRPSAPRLPMRYLRPPSLFLHPVHHRTSPLSSLCPPR